MNQIISPLTDSEQKSQYENEKLYMSVCYVSCPLFVLDPAAAPMSLSGDGGADLIFT